MLIYATYCTYSVFTCDCYVYKELVVTVKEIQSFYKSCDVNFIFRFIFLTDLIIFIFIPGYPGVTRTNDVSIGENSFCIGLRYQSYAECSWKNYTKGDVLIKILVPILFYFFHRRLKRLKREKLTWEERLRMQESR